jgi:hydroxymethylbilane synthase
LIAVERRGLASDAPTLGRDAGEELKRRGGPGFLST